MTIEKLSSEQMKRMCKRGFGELAAELSSEKINELIDVINQINKTNIDRYNYLDLRLTEHDNSYENFRFDFDLIKEASEKDSDNFMQRLDHLYECLREVNEKIDNINEERDQTRATLDDFTVRLDNLENQKSENEKQKNEHSDEQIKNCPFCNFPPMVTSENFGDWFGVKCNSNSNICAIRPRTRLYARRIDALKEWNSRKG